MNSTIQYAPLVSVLTPIFNGQTYVEQCIQSVLSQTYSNIEHVFADGGSTDGTLDILARYQASYPNRFKFVTGPDRGVGSALTRAYQLSKGEIIGWIDSDDKYEFNAVETAVSFFRQNEEAKFLYGRCNLIDEHSNIIGCFVVKDFNKAEWLNIWHYIVFCATFFKREVIERVGFVNDLGNDLSFYLRVAKRFNMYKITETLTNWRLHQGSISLNRSARESRIRRDRAREDLFLVLRYGGSPFSPRALTYFAVIEPAVAEALRPFIGFAYPFLKRLAHQVRYSIAVAQQKHGSFAYPLFENVFYELKMTISELVRKHLGSRYKKG